MNRSSGIGLTSFGMVLVVVGAILRFATSVQTSGFNIHKVGDIFLLVGILMVILSLVIIAMGSRRRVVTRTDVRATPTGQQRTDQRDDWACPSAPSTAHRPSSACRPLSVVAAHSPRFVELEPTVIQVTTANLRAPRGVRRFRRTALSAEPSDGNHRRGRRGRRASWLLAAGRPSCPRGGKRDRPRAASTTSRPCWPTNPPAMPPCTAELAHRRSQSVIRVDLIAKPS